MNVAYMRVRRLDEWNILVIKGFLPQLLMLLPEFRDQKEIQ